MDLTALRALLRTRYFPLLLLAGVYLVVSALTRLTLYVAHVGELDVPLRDFAAVMTIGGAYDVATGLYLFALYGLYLFLLPDRVYRSRAHRVFLLGATAVVLFGLLYLAPVEYFFFDEFNARFNFVAVSYLLYPHEVFINIWQSYPVGRVLAVIGVLTLVIMRWAYRPLARSFETPTRLRQRAAPLLLLLAGVGAAHAGLDITTGRFSHNRVANELARNGVYAFFHALLHNDLDYDQYYVTVDPAEAHARVRQMVAQPNAEFLAGADNPIARHVSYPGRAKPLNVVVLVQESLGADFVGAYGDRRGLTPNIDALAAKGLMFTNVYATGTRTIRGLEGIVASFPPIPGESILKRSNSDGVFTWGTVMATHGYAPLFFYGGYGTFDHMRAFFGANGYEVVDRADMPDAAFSNIWGVSDEDLYRHAIGALDRKHKNREPFFAVVMSTSNHKPFTFPAGIPGVNPEGGGRRSGVRYADYAVGRFFDMVRDKPYFDDTLFVIVGDHGARVYGREEIPMRSYELPLVVYAPKHVKPARVGTLMGQIDIAPTVLGLLNMSYDSVFFGRDVLLKDGNRPYALLSHNRDVALYHDQSLVVLGIQRGVAAYRYSKISNEQHEAERDPADVRDAASLYQTAYHLYRHGQYRLAHPVVAHKSPGAVN